MKFPPSEVEVIAPDFAHHTHTQPGSTMKFPPSEVEVIAPDFAHLPPESRKNQCDNL